MASARFTPAGWRPLALMGALGLLGGCNQYDMFLVGGYQTESFSNKADILFVVDNSTSMQAEATSLANSFGGFIEGLTQLESEYPTDNLGNAVTNYAAYVRDRSNFLNYNIAVVTTDAGSNAGLFLGSDPIVSKTDPDVAGGFVSNLTCEATCFNGAGDVPNGSHTCGDPFPGEITQGYLDCVCDGNWTGNCGAATEEPLESVFMALCRSVPNPPADCFNEENTFTEAEVLSNDGFLRDNATFIPVIVSDEGDNSRRMEVGVGEPVEYRDLFRKFNRRMSWAVIGPERVGSNFPCPTGATPWGTARLEHFVEATGGLYTPITTSQAEGCGTRDFGDALSELGELLTKLATSLPLRSVPIQDTIVVYADGDVVDEAELLGTDQYGLPDWTDGWSYQAAENAILFHGTAVPDFETKIEVFYQPVDGMPRELPF